MENHVIFPVFNFFLVFRKITIFPSLAAFGRPAKIVASVDRALGGKKLRNFVNRAPGSNAVRAGST